MAIIRTQCAGYTYDALNQLTTITDAITHDTTLAYDANGNLTSLTDANSHATTYTYDALNRVAKATDALSRTTTYTHDADGNTTQVEDGNGTTNASVYDNANRLTGVDPNNNSTLDIQYAYDAASRRTSMIDSTGTTTYSYDAANRLTGVTAPTTGTVSCGYDNDNERTSLTYPSTDEVTYGYTDRGQLETVTDWLSHTTSYSYDDAGRLTGITDPNDVVGTLGYNNADQLTSLSYALGSTVLESLAYTVDPAGIVTDLVDSSGTTHYDYDALNRLTAASYPNSDVVDYGYDAVGNRTALTVNGTTTTNTFDAANQLTTSGADTYRHDDNGNLTSKTVGGVTTDYGYDKLNRLTSLSGPASASYVDNGDGLRVSKTVGATTTNYAWDQTGIGQVISDGNDYVWGLGLISQITSGTPTYVQSDGLGSTRLLTDGTGTIVGTQDYDAFGATRAQSGVQLPFTYTGERVDPESGLVYLRNRYLDPTTGRFQTPDPLGFVGSGVNLYAYGSDNPMNATDPLGLCWGCRITDTISSINEQFVHANLDVVATAPYLEYYASYQGLRGINYVGGSLGPLGPATAGVIGAPLVASEGLGLAGDVTIDWVKGHTVNNETIGDEGVRGYINPLHLFVPKPLQGPQVYLPGVHADCSVDWQW